MGNAPLGTVFDAKQAKAIFAEIDADGNGVLTHVELVDGVGRLGIADDWPEKRLKRFIAKFDANDDGELDFNEFKKLCKNICKRNRKKEQSAAEDAAAMAAEEEAAAAKLAASAADSSAGMAAAAAAFEARAEANAAPVGDAPGDTGADEVYEPIDNSGADLEAGEQVFAEMPETYAEPDVAPEAAAAAAAAEGEEGAEEEEEAAEPFPEAEEREWKRRGSSTVYHDPKAEPVTVVVKSPQGATVTAVKGVSEQLIAASVAMPALQPQQKLKISGEINTVKSNLDTREAQSKVVPPKDKAWKSRKTSVKVKETTSSVLAPTWQQPIREQGEQTGVVKQVKAVSAEKIAEATAKPDLNRKQSRKPMEKLQELRSQAQMGNAEGATVDKGDIVGIPSDRKQASKQMFEDNAERVKKMQEERAEKIGAAASDSKHLKASVDVAAKKKASVKGGAPVDAEAAARAAKEQDYDAFMKEQLAQAKLKREQEENDERAEKVAARRLEIQKLAQEKAELAEKEAEEAAAAAAAEAARVAAIEAAKEARLEASRQNIERHSNLEHAEVLGIRGAAQGSGISH